MSGMLPIEASGLRLVVQTERGLAKLVKLSWSKKDASLYIVPYGTSDPTWGYVGVAHDIRPIGDTTVNYAGQGEGRSPKVSLHESGETSATCESSPGMHERYRSERLQGAKLFSPAGGHIASVTSFNTEGLPMLDRRPAGPPEPDVVLVPNGRDNVVQVPIHVGITESKVAGHQLRIRMVRESMPYPLFFGVGVRGESRPSNDPGVLVLAGWGPGALDDVPCSVVFAVTK